MIMMIRIIYKTKEKNIDDWNSRQENISLSLTTTNIKIPHIYRKKRNEIFHNKSPREPLSSNYLDIFPPIFSFQFSCVGGKLRGARLQHICLFEEKGLKSHEKKHKV